MTKNEAIRLLAREALLMFEHDGSSTLDGDTTLHIINQIFYYFGEQLQDKDDEIELLKFRIEEAMKPKTCDGCKHLDGVICKHDRGLYCVRQFEADYFVKDNK